MAVNECAGSEGNTITPLLSPVSSPRSSSDETHETKTTFEGTYVLGSRFAGKPDLRGIHTGEYPKVWHTVCRAFPTGKFLPGHRAKCYPTLEAAQQAYLELRERYHLPWEAYLYQMLPPAIRIISILILLERALVWQVLLTIEQTYNQPVYPMEPEGKF